MSCNNKESLMCLKQNLKTFLKPTQQNPNKAVKKI